MHQPVIVEDQDRRVVQLEQQVAELKDVVRRFVEAAQRFEMPSGELREMARRVLKG